jgi:Arc/MetJ-type ribon-helix-helix transcriptional regulator
MMHLNGLPADLAQFVDDALASGKYQSTEELVCDALHVLQEHADRQGAHRHPDETHADTPPQSPDDYLQALARALRTGEFGHARQLAIAGAARYPDHAELAKSARVLAPPTVTRASRPHTADIQANRAWLKAHRQDYAGQWIALRDGHLLAAAPSFDALVAHVDETHDVLMTKLPA